MPIVNKAFEEFCEKKFEEFSEFVRARWEHTRAGTLECRTRLIKYDLDSGSRYLDFVFLLLPSEICDNRTCSDLNDTWTSVINWLDSLECVQKIPENIWIPKIIFKFFYDLVFMLQFITFYQEFSKRKKEAKPKVDECYDFVKKLEKVYGEFKKVLEKAGPSFPIQADILMSSVSDIDNVMPKLSRGIQALKQGFDNPLICCAYNECYDDRIIAIFNDVSRGKRNPESIVWKYITQYFQFRFWGGIDKATAWATSLYNAHFFGNPERRKRGAERRYRSEPLTTRLFHEMVKPQKNEKIWCAIIDNMDLFYYVKK